MISKAFEQKEGFINLIAGIKSRRIELLCMLMIVFANCENISAVDRREKIHG